MTWWPKSEFKSEFHGRDQSLVHCVCAPQDLSMWSQGVRLQTMSCTRGHYTMVLPGEQVQCGDVLETLPCSHVSPHREIGNNNPAVIPGRKYGPLWHFADSLSWFPVMMMPLWVAPWWYGDSGHHGVLRGIWERLEKVFLESSGGLERLWCPGNRKRFIKVLRGSPENLKKS